MAKYRINYSYWKLDNDMRYVGEPILKYVDGDTIEEVDIAFRMVRNNNDLVKYSPTYFISIEEIKEH